MIDIAVSVDETLPRSVEDLVREGVIHPSTHKILTDTDNDTMVVGWVQSDKAVGDGGIPARIVLSQEVYKDHQLGLIDLQVLLDRYEEDEPVVVPPTSGVIATKSCQLDDSLAPEGVAIH